jgi:hypothetical protein
MKKYDLLREKYPNPCKKCEIKFTQPGRKRYCSLECRSKFFQWIRKNKDPKKYERELNRQKIKARQRVRKRLGLPIDAPKLTNNGRRWKEKDGYKYLLMKNHPNAAKSGYVAEHVVIMSKFINRPLCKGETVHHKNGIRNDNRLENLELWSHSHPFGQRIEDKIKWCKEFLHMYDEDYRNYLNAKGNEIT